MTNGGVRKGAGRPKGKKSEKTEKRLAAVEASGITPLDYLLGVMRDTGVGALLRMDAAKAAAPYVHSKLSSIEVAGPNGEPLSPPLINIGFGNGGPGQPDTSA